MVSGVTVKICELFVAVNLYQTSSSAVPLHAGCDCVASTLVPLVVNVQLWSLLISSVIASVQSSFIGGGGGNFIQIVKVP